MDWLIPTCVGKTFFQAVAILKVTAHPHLCGENGRLNQKGVTVDRLIPTCVGKTLSQWQVEQHAHGPIPAPVWGKRPGRDKSPRLQQLIPAHVGKTFSLVN